MHKNYTSRNSPTLLLKKLLSYKLIDNLNFKGSAVSGVSPYFVIYNPKQFAIPLFNSFSVMKNFTLLSIIFFFTTFAFSQTPCGTISPLDCDQVEVSLPVNLDFNGSGGGILSTGFTMVDPPSTPLIADEAINDANILGLISANLEVSGGSLNVTATNGINFSRLNGNPSSSATNSQMNALAVGFSAASNVIDIRAIIDQPNFAGSLNNNASGSQQAGIWFGLNENNFAKLVVVKSSATQQKIQLAIEQADGVGDAPNFSIAELNTANFNISGVTSISFRISIDPTDNSVSGFYSLNNGTEIQVVGATPSLTAPAKFITGVDHDTDVTTNSLTYAGIMTSTRRATGGSLVISYDSFSVVEDVPVPPAMVSAPYRMNVAGDDYTLGSDLFLAEDTSYLIERDGPSPSFSTTTYTPNPGDTDLYFPRRYNNDFGYAFPIANGNYQVALHMVENFFTASGNRIFDILTEGTVAVNDLDLAASFGKGVLRIETLDVTVTDGVLNIDFLASQNNGIVQAIEILPAPVNQAPEITSVASVDAAENQTGVIDVVATDDTDSEGSGLSFALSGGVDDVLFTIDADNGLVTFITAPDFELPGDTGTDNVYDIQVTVIDSGTLSSVQDIAITVTEVNEAPEITSIDNASVLENQDVAIDVDAIDDNDVQGPGLQYTIEIDPLTDHILFSIDNVTGEVTFLTAPDFENPLDNGADNNYDIKVTATDSGALSATQEITITVTDEDETPVTTDFSFLENFDNYSVSGNLDAISNGDWVKQDGDEGLTGIPVLSEGLTTLTSHSLEINSATEIAVYNFQKLMDTPVSLQANVPFYYGTYFEVSELGGGEGNRIRVALRVDDNSGEAGAGWIRQIIGNYGGAINARLGLGNSNSNSGQEEIYLDQLLQFVVKGVWDGANTISYQYTLAPSINEANNNWINASSTHAVSGIPQLGRIFISSVSTVNNGKIGPIRLSTQYTEVVTELVDSNPFAVFNSTVTDLTIDVDASASLDDGTIASYTWDFGDGSSGSGESTSHTYINGGTYTVVLTVEDTVGNTSITSQEITVEAPFVATFPYQINFQDGDTTPPTGYVKDFGQEYGDKDGELTYGWIKLSDGTPLDLTTPSNGSGRNRTVAGVDLLLNTLIHVQGNDIGSWTGNRATEGVWEIALDNGWYEVAVGVGDPNTDGNAADSPIHYINVEGTNAIPLFVVDFNLPEGDTGRFQTNTVIVQVTDGKLTIDADDEGAFRTKINYATIAQAADPRSMDAELITFMINGIDGTIASTDSSSGTVTLEVLNDSDLTALTPTITVSDAAAIAPLSEVAVDFTEPVDYIITAENGTTKTWTVTVTKEAVAPFTAFINFQDEATTPPTGYTADFGLGFPASPVIGDYGWKKLDDGTSIAVNGANSAGRNRISGSYGAATDQEKLEGTLVHFQGDNITSWSGQNRGNEIIWELEIPNGIYEVTLGLGDKGANNVDSRHTATLEGYTIIPAFRPASTETRVATMIVEVSDNALTMNGLGGFNSKITHIEVTESTGTPVTGILAFDPNTASPILEAGATGSFTSTLSGAGATGIVLNIEDDPVNTTADNFNDWLSLPTTDVPGEFTFGIDASALVATDTRNNRIIATASGFTPAILNADLTVIEAPIVPIATPFRMNVAGAEYTKDTDLYQAEDVSYLVETETTTVSSTAYTPYTVPGGHQDLYYPRRYGPEFSYNFPIANGTYTVAVHMVENFQTAANARIFDVSLEGDLLIDDLDLFATYGKGGLAILSFDVEVIDEELNIDFLASVNNGIVQAIEILPVTLSDAKEILTFAINGIDGTIVSTDATTGTVSLEVLNEADLTALTPTITVSDLAGVAPDTGVENDFTNPVDYVVTAEDGSTKTWTVTVTKEAPPVNVSPVITENQVFSIGESSGLNAVVGTVEATDEDALTYAITAGNEAGIFAIDENTGELTIDQLVDYAAAVQYSLTIEVNDLTNPAVTDQVTINVLDNICNPLSSLPCDQLAVSSLPLNLDFTVANGNLSQSGLTMVLATSARLASDDSNISDSRIPGYAPSLIAQDGTGLSITSTKGIFFSQLQNQVPNRTPNSANTNSQLNALGVGLSAPISTFSVSTTLVVPDFSLSTGNSAQQAGLWYGLDEDRYVKLVLSKTNNTTQRIQLQVENLTNNPGSILEVNMNNFTFTAGEVLNLRLEFDPIANTVQGYYTLGAGSEVLVVASSDATNFLPVPDFYFDGVDYDAANPSALLNFAGIFTTHRNAAVDQSIDFLFKDFAIQEVAAPLSDAAEIVTFTINGIDGTVVSTDASSGTVALEVLNEADLSALTPTITVSADATVDSASEVENDFTSPVDYVVTAENGDEKTWTVTVTQEAPPTGDFAFIEDFEYSLGDLGTVSGGAWQPENTNPDLPVVATSIATGVPNSVRIENDNTVLDYQTLINNPVDLEANVPFYYGTYFKISELGASNGNRIRVAIRVDDDGGLAGAGWVRQIIGNYGGFVARLGLAGSESNMGETAIAPDQLLQFVVKGVWDGASTISYQYSLTPTLVEGDNTWIDATSSQTASGTPKLGRIFISTTSTGNTGNIGPIRLSTDYTEVVTEEITEEATPCSPFSTLPCDQIVTSNTVDLNFDGTGVGLSNTGFTMVDPYSGTRVAVDGTPSNTDVPGYEPGNLALTGDNLVITANKGIAYLDNNAQINTLGVGLQNINSTITIETKLLGITTGTGSAQAGLWFGIDDENFVKLNVNNNDNVELRVERVGVSGNNTTDQLQVNAGASGQDVVLEMIIDPTVLTVEAFYTVGTGTRTSLGSLGIPSNYTTGKEINPEIGNASFAGVYATYRNNANSFDATFDNFSITKEEVPLAFNFDVNDLSFFGTVGTPVAAKTVTLSATSGTPTFVFGDEAESSSWLILPTNPVLGELEFGIVEGLTAGNYNTTIFAIDDSGLGYATAELEIVLTISEVGTPQILGVSPANGATAVSVNTSISANDIFVPNLDANGNAGIDNGSITAATVQLFKESVGSTPIAAGVNGTGGGDAISLVPSLPLESNTTYVFVIDGVLDTTGVPFEVFTSTFTTDGGGGGPTTDLDNVSFTNAGAVASGAKYSTLTKGPDGKLYGLEIDGDVHRWSINADGTLANEEVLNDWKSAYGSRAAIGFAFDPDATAGNLIAYLTHQSGALNNAPSWDGKISRITGVNLENEDLVVTNLPRSKKDHLTNSIAFRPTEPNVLYFNQGSNSAAGAPDNSWGNRKERLLSAASLRLDLDKLPEGQWPLDAKTTMDATAINGVNTNSPTLASTVSTFTEDGQTFSDDGTYNPFYVNAPLTLYATGIRNAYDLVWHTNGQLYIPTNGTAGGSNAPASISGTRRPDGMVYDHSNPLYPSVPASNNNDTQRDWLFRVNPNTGLGYYGHPNPLRGEFVLNRGDADVNRGGNTYDGVQADVNYRGAAFDFEFNKSPNGVIEYRSTAENGNLQGALLVVRYSGGKDIIALVPDGPGGDVTTFKEGIPGFGGFGSPLDLMEDVTTGNIYVSDYGRSEIVLLKPQNQSTPMPLIVVSSEEFAGDAVSSGNAIYSEEITLSNLGNANLENIIAQITGVDSDQFSISVLPGSVASQNSSSFTVSFDPTSNGPKFAQLTLTGTDADPVVINLSGLGKQGLGGSNEPSLQWILDTQLGNGVVDVGDENASSNVFDLGGLTVGSDAYKAALTEMLGDEVSIQSFERAIDAPITMELLSVYGPTGSNPVVALGWYETGNAASTNELFTVTNSPTSNGQRLNPPLIGQDEFDPGTQSFGFYSRWPAFQNRLLFSEDALNTFSGAIPHHVRVYELPGEENAYIIATEEHISGFDYQDIVIIARNIKPVGDNPIVACSPISTLDCDEIEVALPFSLNFNGTEGGLSNTGFTMVDNPSARIAADGPISNANVPGYEPGQLSISNDNLILTANNGIAFVTNGTGSGLSTDVNSQINTLGVGFDADAYGNFSITTTIMNPYTDGNNDSEQAGVWFGLNEDNFVKLIADGNGRVELRSELNAISVNANQVIATIPNLNTSTVQLRMFVDIDNALIVPHYTLNGGVEVALDPLPLPSEYLAGNTAYDNQSFAGVFASKRRELIADVVYTFEDFAITPENNPVAFEPININFSRIADAAPADYLVDSGLGFDDRGNDYSYGWLTTDGQTSLDLSTNTRNRAVAGVNVLQNTLNHMQYGDTGGSNGIATEGIWEIAVPNGTYIVSVAVGDPSVDNTNTQYSINIEGTNIIDKYEASGAEGAATRFTSASTTVLVLDGRLSIDAIGGFNTKINSLTIRGGGEITQPFFANVSPDDEAINVSVTGFQINVDVITPTGYELDLTTLNGNVSLFKISAGGQEELVPSNANDTAGGDAITLTPLVNLDIFSDYVFRLSSGIEANRIGDVSDRIPFTAFESSFTTGDVDSTIDLDLTGVTFTKVEGGTALGESTFGERFSSLVVGPDGKLYASTIGNFNADGQIFRWDMATDGTLINLEKLSPNLQGNPHPTTGVPSNNDRLIIGFTFDPASTAGNLIAYITHSSASVTNGPEWDGVLTRLSGPNLEEVQDLIIHLPRSAKDHLTNSVITGPEGDLYITQGSNSAGGAPDTNWAFRPERLLAAAVLKVELDKLPASQNLPLSAFTTDNISVINNAPISSIQMSDGTYNPYASASPLTIFATGVRNAYDLVWHSNGWLYVPTNGTAGNQSDNPNQSSPNSPSTDDFELARRIDGLTSIPDVPALFGGGTQKDWLFKTQGGSYHGHPNPYRGEFVLNHGGLTYSGLPGQEDASYKDVAKYASSVAPDPNYRQPAYDFDFNKSPNGAIEYKSNAFGGKLQGLLMVVRFSGQDDLLVMQPAASGDIANVNGDVPGLGGFDDPLDVVEDPRTGNIYVSEYDRSGNQNLRITLLRADVQSITGPEITALPNELIFETTVGTQGPQSETKTVSVVNEGTGVLTIQSASITGAFADQFDTVSPSGAVTLNPSESQEYTVTYAPELTNTNLGYQEASLTILSDDAVNPTFEIGLHALKKAGGAGGNEPALQNVVNALGIGIDVGWLSLTNGTSAELQGDEVDVSLWVKASDAPINVTPVGRYSPAEELPYGWYSAGDASATNQIAVLSGEGSQAQSLFPEIASGDTFFDPLGAVFGFYVESNTFGRFSYTEDALNTGVPHATRVYPMKERDGTPIENSYLITFEDASNGDYQDYMFIIDNVIPFEDGTLVLNFNPTEVEFVASIGQDDIPVQQLTLSGNGGVSAEEIELAASEPWVVLPATYALNSPFDIGIDIVGLPRGSYSATLTASADFYQAAVTTVNLTITNELVYTYQFNFQDPDDVVTSPEGYVDDLGVPYGEQSTILGNLTYGWVEPGTLTPVDAAVNARNRVTGVQDGVLLQTFTIMGHPTPASFPLYDWVVDVPNGAYSVNISVGERDFVNSNHILDVNGTEVINFIQGSIDDGPFYGTDTRVVDVTDGTLRLSLGNGGSNAKPNYIRLAPVNTALFPPTLVATFDGNLSAPNTYRGSVAVTLEATDNSESGGIASITYILDDAPETVYENPVTIAGTGDHTLVVRAEDLNGNVIEETIDLTIETPTGALLTLENMTKVPGTNRGFPSDDYYTFYRLGNPGQAIAYDSNVMRLNNTGTGDLVITAATVSDNNDYVYDVLDGSGTISELPITISPGDFAELDITFIGTTGNGSNGIFVEDIEIISNADNALENIAVLHGGYAPQPEGGDEINAQEVFDAFGFQTSMLSIVNDNGTISPPNGTPFRPSSNYPDADNINAGYEGDLILSEFFEQSDPNQPVIGIQLSALHGGPGSNNARLIATDGSTAGGMNFGHNQFWYQTLLPKDDENDGINAGIANTISTPFRIAIGGQTTSLRNSSTGQPLLGVRVFKVIDQDGNIVPNEYIALQDFIANGCGAGSANCDWNDNTFYFINIRPVGVPTAQPIADLLANSNEEFTLDISENFDSGYPGNTLTYAISSAEGSLPSWVRIDALTGSLSGTPPMDAPISIDVVVEASDANGLVASSTVAVLINVSPIAQDDAVTVVQNIASSLEGLLENDSEPNGQTFSISSVETPLNGLATIQDGGLAITYTPNLDFIGDDSFAYVIEDATGLTATANVSVTVTAENQAPIVNIITDVTNGPAALSVNFDGSESIDDQNAIVEYLWDFGDGSVTSTEPIVNHVYTTAGSFNATLRVTDAQGLSGSAAIQIVVTSPPNSDPVAVATVTPGAIALEYNFDGSGSSDVEGVLSYEWDFGDGSPTVTDVAPVHVYVVAGVYNVILTVTDTDNVTNSTTIIVDTEESVVGDFVLRINAGGPETNYLGNTYLADQNFVGGKVYVNTNAEVPVLYQTERSALPPVFSYGIDLPNGEYRITLHFAEIFFGATGGGTLGTAQRIFDVAIEGATVLDDFDINAEVGPQTIVTRDFDVTVVDGQLNIDLDAEGADGVNQPKLSAIEVVNLVSVNTDPVAVANANILNGTSPLEVSFDGSASTDLEGELTYIWNFGNGDTSTEANPVYVYTTAGSFIATLTVTDEAGSSDSAELIITVEEPVISDFALRINAGGPATSFGGNDYIADTNFVGGKIFANAAATVPVLYQTERSALPPAFGYEIPLTNGEYSITLHFAEIYWGATGGGPLGTAQRIFDVVIEGNTVLDDFDINAVAGPQTAITRTFNINVVDGVLNMDFDAQGADGVNQPKLSAIEIVGQTANEAPTAIAFATPESGVAPLEVSFDGSGSTDLEGGLTYAWDFGNGDTSTVANPVYVYTTAGSFTATLAVTDEDGTVDADSVTISVNESLASDVFWLEAECGTIGSGWQVIDDGSASGGQYIIPPAGNSIDAPSTDSGTYVVFNVNASAGRYDIHGLVNAPTSGDDSFWVRVNDGPWSRWNQIAQSNVFVWDKVHNQVGSASPVEVVFDLVEGNNRIEFAPREDGTGLDKLYITKNGDFPSGIGGAATNCNSVNAAPVAVASSNFSEGVAPFAIDFDGTGSRDDKGIVSFIWNFDDNGAGATTENTTYVFESPGFYNVTLTVTDAEGLETTTSVEINITSTVNINPTAVATATPLSGISPLEVSFNGSGSTDVEGDLTYAWDFKDGVTSTEINPIHTFASVGSYIVSLLVTDEDGETDETFIEINVEEPLVIEGDCNGILTDVTDPVGSGTITSRNDFIPAEDRFLTTMVSASGWMREEYPLPQAQVG